MDEKICYISNALGVKIKNPLDPESSSNSESLKNDEEEDNVDDGQDGQDELGETLGENI